MRGHVFRRRSPGVTLAVLVVFGMTAAACSSSSPSAKPSTKPRPTSTARDGEERRSSNEAEQEGRDGGGDGESSGEAEQEQHGLDPKLHEDGTGHERADLYRASLAQFAKLKVEGGGVAPSAAYGGNALQWKQIGPVPMTSTPRFGNTGGPYGGAVFDLAIDPSGTTDKIAYAALDGGVWKTSDGGVNWAPKTDKMSTLSVGAVALDPVTPSIVYAGTGNIFNQGFFNAIGVYRSIDGGNNWSIVSGSSVLRGKGINKIVVPSPNVIVAATDSGLYRSTNAGVSFALVPVGGVADGFISDLDLRPGTTGPIYAAMCTKDVDAGNRCAHGKGIFKSADQGATFGAASNLVGAGHAGAPAAGTYKFMSFAVSSNGATMYADFESNAGNLLGLWKSANSGASWTNLTAKVPSAAVACQCDYDQTIGIDPVDPQKMYMGFQDVWYTGNGGTTFKNITTDNVHVDHHALVFSPAAHRTAGDQTTRAWMGSDGGVSFTDNAGGSWTNRNATFATALLRGIDTGHGPTNNKWTYGGMQDNGTAVHRPTLAGSTWERWLGGDGWTPAVDWQNPQNAHGFANGYYLWTSDGGVHENFGDVPCGAPYFVAPTVDPNNGNKIYVVRNCGATQTVYKSIDRGLSFNEFYTRTTDSEIKSMAMSPADSNQMWLGFSDGSLVHLTNLSGTPTDTVVTLDSISGQAAIVAVDQADPQRVAVAYGGYSGALPPSMTKHLFLSADGGASWCDCGGWAGDLTQRIPDMPVYSVVFDPNSTPHAIIVSTDAGVLRTVDNGATWQVLGTGLPNANVTSLAIDATVVPSVLKAGTYGRSAWQLSVPPVGTADYLLMNTLKSAVGGAPNLAKAGPAVNAFVSDTVDGVTRPVLAFPQKNGLRLAPTSGVLPNAGTYTIAALFKMSTVDQFERIFETSNGTIDAGLYVDNGFLDFYSKGVGAAQTIAANTWVQVVMTRDAATKKVTGYVNGAKQFSFTDSTDLAVIKGSTLKFFVDDDPTGTETSSGAVARIRVFPNALTDSQVLYLDRLAVTGPPTVASISPNSIARGASNVTLAISGTNFSPNSTLTLPPDSGVGMQITSVTYVSSTQLSAVVTAPAGVVAGNRSVRVGTDRGSGLCACTFTVT